ncbi:putative xyloglucan endotransglucosylase/hydrolase protein 23 [Carex littledalei]|uniref:Xyloglucan endotransglucosylase/hydrolase n=1 Tax=Carex littledalei TaxID=544730 RepID=A0A833QFQ7_9POAL|nr:putative xyloglucan endotransglucosylase/hydrolase protein 23 [Carex littledalei]
MASLSSTPKLVSIFGALLVFFSLFSRPSFADTFDKEIEMVWGSGNAKQSDDGTQLSLSLDTRSGSAFKSKDALLVDDIPLRDYKNYEDKGLFFPNRQPMNVYGSIWDGDGWATRGGRDKTDWSQAPFTVHYQNFNPQACVYQKASMVCNLPDEGDYSWLDEMLDESQQEKMKWVHDNFKLYDYCTDLRQWPDGGVPLECQLG